MDKSILKQSQNPTGMWQWPIGAFKTQPGSVARILYNDRWAEMMNMSVGDAGIVCIFLSTSLCTMAMETDFKY